MESTPAPVDLNKLKGILSKAKAVMNKAEENRPSAKQTKGRDYEDTLVESTSYDDNDDRFESALNGMQTGGNSTIEAIDPSVANYADYVNNSRLPPAIKKAMLEMPIPRSNGLSHTFNKEDVADLIDKPAKQSKPAPRPAQRTQLNEATQKNSDSITVSKTELKEMVDAIVNEKLLEFFMKTSSQKITEDAVKRTINLLIKEGKLTPKKKTI